MSPSVSVVCWMSWLPTLTMGRWWKPFRMRMSWFLSATSVSTGRSKRSPRITTASCRSLAMATQRSSLPRTACGQTASLRRPGRREPTCGSPITRRPLQATERKTFSGQDHAVSRSEGQWIERNGHGDRAGSRRLTGEPQVGQSPPVSSMRRAMSACTAIRPSSIVAMRPWAIAAALRRSSRRFSVLCAGAVLSSTGTACGSSCSAASRAWLQAKCRLSWITCRPEALALPRMLDHPRQVGQPLGRGQSLP